MDIIALASEDRVRLNADNDEEIAVRAVVYAAVTLTADTECLSVIYTCRNVYAYGFLNSYSAYAAALGAGICDDLALAVTVRTGLSRGNSSERSSLRGLDLTSALTVGTYLSGSTCCCSAALARIADTETVYLDLALNARAGFHEAYIESLADISASLGSICGGAS